MSMGICKSGWCELEVIGERSVLFMEVWSLLMLVSLLEISWLDWVRRLVVERICVRWFVSVVFCGCIVGDENEKVLLKVILYVI